MKHIRIFLLLLAAAGLSLFASCGGDDPEPEPTNIDLLSITWQISNVTSGGVTNFSNFRITLTATNGSPATYSITNPDGIPQPNYTTPNQTSGSWSVNNTDNPTQLIFDGNTTAAVTISGLSASGVTLTWNVPIDIDKTEPTYTYQLEPVATP